MKDFPRPVPVEVGIFGEAHQLHRLTYIDILELLGQAADTMKDQLAKTVKKGVASNQDALMLMLEAGGPLVDGIMTRSFPSFKEWDQLPAGSATGLLEIIVEENDLAGILENFSKVRNKIAMKVQSLKS